MTEEEEEKEDNFTKIARTAMWVFGIIVYPFNFYWMFPLSEIHIFYTAVGAAFASVISVVFILGPILGILGLIKKKADEREKKKNDCEVAAKSTPGVSSREQDKLKTLRAVPLISASVALYQNTEVTEALVRRSIPDDLQDEPELVNEVLQQAKQLVAVVRKKHEKFASMKDAVEEVVETKKHLIGEEARARLFRSLSAESQQADLPKGD